MIATIKRLCFKWLHNRSKKHSCWTNKQLLGKNIKEIVFFVYMRRTLNIQFLYYREYIPFGLYIRSLCNIFTTNPYFSDTNCNISIITNISMLSPSTDLLFLYINEVKTIGNIIPLKTKIIFIQADYIINHDRDDFNFVYNYVNIKNPINSYILEYNPLNVHFYNNNFTNLKYCYIPLLYTNYLEQIYEPHKLNIPRNKRTIDVLYLGSLNDRREKMIKRIRVKYNLVQVQFITDIKQYVELIENSKMVINIFSKEDNKPFDYYRLSLLYANKVLVLNEKMQHIDVSIDEIPAKMSDVMINVEYDELPNEIDNYMNKPEQDICELTENTYEIFKQFDMNPRVVDFFQQYNF